MKKVYVIALVLAAAGGIVLLSITKHAKSESAKTNDHPARHAGVRADSQDEKVGALRQEELSGAAKANKPDASTSRTALSGQELNDEGKVSANEANRLTEMGRSMEELMRLARELQREMAELQRHKRKSKANKEANPDSQSKPRG